MLVIGAAITLGIGTAFAFATSNNNTANCCNVEASTCCGLPCPAPNQCPIPCCQGGSAESCKK